MPNINVTTTNYGGEVLDNILAKTALGNEVVEKGLIHVVPGIQKKMSIPRMSVNGTFLQKRKARIAIDGSDSKGDINYDERELNPEDLMLYTEFVPSNYENIWRQFQPTGNLVFEQLPSNVQVKMLDLILKKASAEMGDHYINCTKGNGNTEFFNGLVNKIMGDKDTIYAAKGATTWVKKLENLYKAIPEEIVDDVNLTIIMNTKDYVEYDSELKAQTAKNVDPTEKRVQAYNGIRIVTLARWPKGLVVASICGLGEESNFWAAVNMESDETAVLIDRVTNASEVYFVKILMKADVNTAFGEFCVVLDERKQGTATLAGTTISGVGKASTYTQSATLSDNVTYNISATGATLGKTVTVTNAQSASKNITIGATVIAKGKSATFHYAPNADGDLAWIAEPTAVDE